ncbi:MAG: BREX system P-loop protein BrxC [Thermoguttaceae bacterium]|nr:BREX system P-loop protein BrxC [Thermoguttaceae bacterium]
MIVREMFAEDVERKISGVVKVGETDSVEQEIREYVVTKELKKHFTAFFNYYDKSFSEPTDDVGVWISGFFGSGKSHLLKILSYLLEDKKIGATTTVEAFRQKFADDPATFMLVDRATKAPTETILFNIDAKSPIKKDSTAVLSVFSRTFYDHLGYKGDNLKVVELEKYLDREGKRDEFRSAIEKVGGDSWENVRKSFGFKKKIVVAALVDLGMEEKDAEKWYDDKEEARQFNIEQFVGDVKEYVDRKSSDFRLLFMVDEVGQYVGADVDKLLNLQTIVEELGSKCKGKVWVVCTGQEALDKVIKVREAAFSKIQDRFRLRLSLSSSSVGEVIQKRILTKKSDAEKKLEKVYGKRESELRNLFCFQGARSDVKGFESASEFAACFPFVPYQFLVVKNVFVEIRNHAIKGANMSSGERSMLSGFQEAVKTVLRRDENALVPFYCFFESLYSFLDVDVRNVFERCEQAARDHKGLEPQDLNLLKLLYLLRYVDDVPSNDENLTILMADALDVDKIKLREQVGASLQRLLYENYVGRNGEIYYFLTDEEQDVRRGIRETTVDAGEVVAEIGKLIFANIYDAKKFRDKSGTDFEFDKYVDD